MRYHVLLLAPLMLTGCGGGSSSSTPSNSLRASALTPSGLTATFAESSTTLALDNRTAFSYTLTLTNHTSHAVTYLLASPSGIPIGRTSAVFTIVDAAGTVLYGQFNDGPITVSDASFTIAPGQSLSDTTNAGVLFSAPGRYTAIARFTLQTDAAVGPKSTVVGPLTVTVQ